MPSRRSERQEKIDRIVERVLERLEQEWSEGETDATGVEAIVSRIEREVLRQVTEEMLRERSQRRKRNQRLCLRRGRPQEPPSGSSHPLRPGAGGRSLLLLLPVPGRTLPARPAVGLGPPEHHSRRAGPHHRRGRV